MLLQQHSAVHQYRLAHAGSRVAAGAVNCEGRIVVRAERCGNETALADIVHAVEAAQARAAPVQRLADKVAGGFAVGVLALSTATFAFWAAAGPRLFPQACYPRMPCWQTPCSHVLMRAGYLSACVHSVVPGVSYEPYVFQQSSGLSTAFGLRVLGLGSERSHHLSR